MPFSLILTFAVACGLAVGNLYYCQPLLGLLGHEFGVGTARAGTLVTFTQVGYVAALILVAPLGDLLENRKLVTTVFSLGVISSLLAASAQSFTIFAASSLALGLTAGVAQMLVPFAANLATPEKRGVVVGQVMSGLLTGILLARATAAFISGALGWRAVYIFSAVLVFGMAIVLRLRLPQRRPELLHSYGELIRSLGTIFLGQPVLQRRALYQAAMFGSFSTFWTGITFLLAGRWHFTQAQIGLFALAGAVGAMFASVAGHLADRGHSKIATGGAFLLAIGALSLTLIPGHISTLVAGAILLDLAVNTCLVVGQHAIYGLDPASRSRINTIFIATLFVGGAIGSALTGLAYARGGWTAVVGLGATFPTVAFLFWLGEKPAKPPTTDEQVKVLAEV